MTLASVDAVEAAACPFVPCRIPPQPFFAKLLRRPDRQGATTAVANLIRSTWPAMPSVNDRARVCLPFRVSASDEALRRELFRRALATYIERGAIGVPESTALDHLRGCLELNDQAVAHIEREIVKPRLQSAIEIELRKGVDATTYDRAMRAASALWATPALRDEVYSAAASRFMQQWFDGLIASRRVSPDQFIAFTSAAGQLHINPSFNRKAEGELRQCALLWRIDHGDIPTIEASVHLQKGEECYFEAPARWLEHRRQTQTVGYSSSGMSFRIARGVYYRVGASRPRRVVTEGLAEIDAGTVYITSKRVVFSGAVRNFAVRLDAVLSVHAFADGFALEKATGKHPHILLGGSSETALCILSELLNR